MLRSNTWCLVTTFLVYVIATQVPLHSSHAVWQPATLDDEHLGDWSLNTTPNPNSTDHLVFETVHSLLQRWPNTRMRNGHAIVPGIIPKGTLFYHGTSRNALPTGHEWFATDPEHSYIFCGNDPDEECWQFTLVVTQTLKVVYFDGSSATKLPYGTLDTQDLFLWGEPRGGGLEEDKQRIKDICKWGKEYGVDGFVRYSFLISDELSEVMLCDLTSGVRVVSSSNLVSRLLQWPQQTILLKMSTFEIMNAASWHNRFPGETRVKLDLAGLVTFYDTQLAPSLVAIRAGQERWDHRVQNISSEDLSTAKARLEKALTGSGRLSSGIDWATLIQVIIDRYAQRLEFVRYLLSAPTTSLDDVLDSVNKTQTQLRIMLTPYLVLVATPTDPSDETELDWAIPIFKLCAMTHTHSMNSELPFMTAAEKLLLQAVRGTTREICRVVTKMWATGVLAGLDPLLNTKEYPDIARVTSLRNAWAEDLNHLMAWLDWSEWVKCDPACGREEACYLPTWPIGFPGQPPYGKTDQHSDSDSPRSKTLTAAEKRVAEMFEVFQPTSDEWIRPQPKCIPRVAPYSF
ncbi:hypothetical protein J3R83DRAFT_13734 [Lanmaoa asiatica]|nr:hypothetical protein J3R83DRAFT_13734 [Lanmaoa asiatica]